MKVVGFPKKHPRRERIQRMLILLALKLKKMLSQKQMEINLLAGDSFPAEMAQSYANTSGSNAIIMKIFLKKTDQC